MRGNRKTASNKTGGAENVGCDVTETAQKFYNMQLVNSSFKYGYSSIARETSTKQRRVRWYERLQYLLHTYKNIKVERGIKNILSNQKRSLKEIFDGISSICRGQYRACFDQRAFVGPPLGHVTYRNVLDETWQFHRRQGVYLPFTQWRSNYRNEQIVTRYLRERTYLSTVYPDLILHHRDVLDERWLNQNNPISGKLFICLLYTDVVTNETNRCWQGIRTSARAYLRHTLTSFYVLERARRTVIKPKQSHRRQSVYLPSTQWRSNYRNEQMLTRSSYEHTCLSTVYPDLILHTVTC